MERVVDWQPPLLPVAGGGVFPVRSVWCAGRNYAEHAQAKASVFGYAVGVDLTRRDVQARARKTGQPWEMSKGFDQSGPIGLVASEKDWKPDAQARIGLLVDGEQRQSGRLGEMLWPVPELLAALSRTVTLGPGDAVFTGTPAGVAALEPEQRVRARIDGLPELDFTLVAG